MALGRTASFSIGQNKRPMIFFFDPSIWVGKKFVARVTSRGRFYLSRFYFMTVQANFRTILCRPHTVIDRTCPVFGMRKNSGRGKTLTRSSFSPSSLLSLRLGTWFSLATTKGKNEETKKPNQHKKNLAAWA